MTDLAIAGAVLGLSGGISPGPLLALVVSETLNRGVAGGIRVAVAPLITDLPIVAAVFLVLSRLADVAPVLGAVTLAGAAFLVFLGIAGIGTRAPDVQSTDSTQTSLIRGVVTNFLNPSPYLFWLTVGGPLVVGAAANGLAGPAAFLVSHYLLLVGSKIAVAVVVSRSRSVLGGRSFIWMNRALGVVLLGFAAIFLWNGLVYLGLASRPS
jgi:threonine/homoserine/homoserine lactone efflux protein